MNWLGDLPNAGYVTQREKALSDAMMLYLRAFERMADGRQLLLMMVIEGFDKWAAIARKEFQAWRISDEELRATFAYMVQLAGRDPIEQLAQLVKIKPGRTFTEEEKLHIGRYGFAPESVLKQ